MSDAIDARPLPTPTDLSEPFWAACREEVLTAQRCASCSTYNFPPRDFCQGCFSHELVWVPVSGRGTVYSYTVIWRPQTPAFPTPYVVAIVDMEEGYQSMTNVVGADAASVAVGDQVETVFERRSDVITLPVLRIVR